MAPDLASHLTPHKDDMYYQRVFPTAEFARRRAAVAATIGNAVAVLRGAPATGAFDRFRQFNDFFYLSGVEAPHSYLRIDGRTARSTLYLLPQDAKLAESEGAEISATFPEETCNLTSVDEVKPLAALAGDLANAAELFVCRAPQEAAQMCQDTLEVQARLAAADPWSSARGSFPETIAQLAPHAKVRDLSPVLAEMRHIKSEAEIAQMRHAGRLTALAVSEAIRCTEPGLLEGQLRAVADYVFVLNGASGGGYRPIIASGENIWNMHYYRNDCRLNAGDLVLMDYAPDCMCYTSDIGRMWPVQGKYAPWQRELYSFVVEYHLQLLDLIAPGKTRQEICQQAAERLLPTVARTHWSRPTYEPAVRQMLEVDNPLTHGVGMAVHEYARYQEDPLQPGQVFALDPQLWVREDRLYVRIEDTVAVTDSGVENLTQGCPHDLDEVEQLMQESGLFQLRGDLFAD